MKHPIIPTNVSSNPVPNPSSEGGFNGSHRETPPKEVSHGHVGPGVASFIPWWNLVNNSRLSIHSNTIDFSQHAFPPVAITDMDTMDSLALSYNMSYATT